MNGLKDVALLLPFKLGNYQFFRQWFAEAWQATGGRVKVDVKLPWRFRMLLGKLGAVRNYRPFTRRRLVICAAGRPDYFAWPWSYFYEVIPVLWDCWPKYHDALVNFVRRNHVKMIFCTSSQTAEFVRNKCQGVKVIWLPEGIKVSAYPMGPKLIDRPVDVLELGRQNPSVHAALLSVGEKIRLQYQKGPRLLFPDFDSLTLGLRSAKMIVCYPRCDTHPEHAGDVETMTQRYWECMLSGALIIGRAPKELIEFCGYNPVIELGEKPLEVVEKILSDPSLWQQLVDRNRTFAEQYADWRERIKLVRRELLEQ